MMGKALFRWQYQQFSKDWSELNIEASLFHMNWQGLIDTIGRFHLWNACRVKAIPAVAEGGKGEKILKVQKFCKKKQDRKKLSLIRITFSPRK